MTRRSCEKRLNALEDALGSTTDRDPKEYPIPESWVEHVPPWLRDDHDDAFMFMLKAVYGDFDTARDGQWYQENALAENIKADVRARKREQYGTADDSEDAGTE